MVLRSILGGVKENGLWRRRFNSEIYRSFKEPDIIKCFKIKRMNWASHIARMDERDPVKKIFAARPFTSRKRGRPKLRWLDSVDSDFRVIGARDWQTRSRNRQSWRNLQRKAMAHPGLSCQI